MKPQCNPCSLQFHMIIICHDNQMRWTAEIVVNLSISSQRWAVGNLKKKVLKIIKFSYTIKNR